MNTKNNTVLITGGSDGIGLELARHFSKLGNEVIITGRSQEKLNKATALFKDLKPIRADVTSEQDIAVLVDRLYKEHPTLNIVINNAGIYLGGNIATDPKAFEKSSTEMLTNYLSVVRLNERLLPLLQKQSTAAIVNVTSRAAIVPRLDSVSYSASKAALHAYTVALRLLLRHSNVNVFELMPPVVDTSFSGVGGGSGGISTNEVANALLIAMENNEYEIHVAGTEYLYQLYLKSPNEALHFINNIK